MRLHQCPGVRCVEMVPRSQLACREHWLELPKDLRDRIWHAYRSKSDEHPALVVEAVRFLRGDAA